MSSLREAESSSSSEFAEEIWERRPRVLLLHAFTQQSPRPLVGLCFSPRAADSNKASRVEFSEGQVFGTERGETSRPTISWPPCLLRGTLPRGWWAQLGGFPHSACMHGLSSQGKEKLNLNAILGLDDVASDVADVSSSSGVPSSKALCGDGDAGDEKAQQASQAQRREDSRCSSEASSRPAHEAEVFHWEPSSSSLATTEAPRLREKSASALPAGSFQVLLKDEQLRSTRLKCVGSSVVKTDPFSCVSAAPDSSSSKPLSAILPQAICVCLRRAELDTAQNELRTLKRRLSSETAALKTSHAQSLAEERAQWEHERAKLLIEKEKLQAMVQQ